MGAGDAGRPRLTADVAIIGAGAAGITTAIALRRSNPSKSVLVLDGAPRPGAKILVSGGSRCNVTNAIVTERDFWGGNRAIIRRVLRAFPASGAVEWFAAMGVALHVEEHGKLFPDSNRARDVLDALLREMHASGARLLAPARVVAIERVHDLFELETSTGRVTASRVVLATGGQSLPKSGSDGAGFEMARRLGHTIVPTTPALVPLVLAGGADAVHTSLAGVTHDVELAVTVDRSIALRLAGSLLWTHFGISGPVVLNASRHWLRARAQGRDAGLLLNVLPGRRFEAADTALTALAAERPRATVHTALAGDVPGAVAGAVLDLAGVERTRVLAHLAREERRRLAHALTEWPLPVVDSRGYNVAEATAGGVTLDEIDPRTMASRRCPGLHLVGEVLDVDGRIGGFNFQWAWSSGHVAGHALATQP